MVEDRELFIGLDVSKDSRAVAAAEGGRGGEVRSHGEIGSDAGSVRRLVRKLERPGLRLRFCYEAGPTEDGLKRLIEELGHECAVIAPSLIPRRPGERVKTTRRDAERPARLFRAGELAEIWTPDEAREAMRDLVRAREAVVKDRTRKRQEIRSFRGDDAELGEMSAQSIREHRPLPDQQVARLDPHRVPDRGLQDERRRAPHMAHRHPGSHRRGASSHRDR